MDAFNPIDVSSNFGIVIPTPVTTSGTIPSTSADYIRCTAGTVGSRIMSRLEGLQLYIDQLDMTWKH